MNYKQKDYYISAKENEYYKVLNVVDWIWVNNPEAFSQK